MARSATVLDIIQRTTDALLSVERPSALVGSNNDDARLFLELFRQNGDTLSASYMWPTLIRRHTITLVDGQDSYALPEDYDYRLSATEWDTNNQWGIIGPLTDQEWEAEIYGIVNDGPRIKFTLRGDGDNRFLVHPTPDSAMDGNTITFLYKSSSWLRPKTWAASTSFAAGKYCSYNGNIYLTTSGGTTGATAPTHTTGSSSDGGVTWTYTDAPYDIPKADTDVPLFDADLMQLGIMWRWKRAHEMQYQDILQEFSLMLESQQSAARGLRTLSLAKPRGYAFLDGNNVPETGYGS